MVTQPFLEETPPNRLFDIVVRIPGNRGYPSGQMPQSKVDSHAARYSKMLPANSTVEVLWRGLIKAAYRGGHRIELNDLRKFSGLFTPDDPESCKILDALTNKLV